MTSSGSGGRPVNEVDSLKYESEFGKNQWLKADLNWKLSSSQLKIHGQLKRCYSGWCDLDRVMAFWLLLGRCINRNSVKRKRSRHPEHHQKLPIFVCQDELG